MLKVRIKLGKGNETLDRQLRDIINGDHSLSLVEKDDVANLMISDCPNTLAKASSGSTVKVLIVCAGTQKTEAIKGVQTLTPGETLKRISSLSAT